MEQVELSSQTAPAAASAIGTKLLRREVLLHAGPIDSTPLVYAASWWAADTVGQYITDTQQPIWVNLMQGRIETHRDIQVVQLGSSAALEEALGCQGPFWGRQYFFWHDSKPLTLIFEVFSNNLVEYLGPQALQPQL